LFQVYNSKNPAKSDNKANNNNNNNPEAAREARGNSEARTGINTYGLK